MQNPFHPQQIPFSFGRSPETLRHFFEQELRKPVSLVITSNSTSMLSVRKRDSSLHIRLHGLFLNAGEGVIGEILSFLRTRRGPMPLFRKFIREHRDQIQAGPGRKVSLKTTGRWHELQELYDTVNA